MEKIKVSIELTDNWNREEFRQLVYNIKNKLYDTNNVEYELWIITTNDTSSYVYAVAEQLNVPQDRVILCLTDSTKVGQIITNKDVHFDNKETIVQAVTLNGSIWGILVDRKLDYYNLGFKYITDFKRFSEAILRKRQDEKI